MRLSESRRTPGGAGGCVVYRVYSRTLWLHATKKAERARGPFCRLAGWTSFFGDNTWEGRPGTRLEPPTSIRQSRLPRSSFELDAQSRLSRFCPEFRAVAVSVVRGSPTPHNRSVRGRRPAHNAPADPHARRAPRNSSAKTS